MLLSGTSAAVVPGPGASRPVPIIPRPPRAQAPELVPFSSLDLASLSNQASAIAWLSATAAVPVPSGMRQALPVARTAATQTSAMPEPPSMQQPQLPVLEEDHSLPPAAAVAPASAPPLPCPETSARPLSAVAPVDDAQPQQHPVLLMARLQVRSAVALDDAHQVDASVGTTEQMAGDDNGKVSVDGAAAGQQEEWPIRRSDTFIGHRVLPAPDEAAWTEACAVLSESPFVTTRPTTDQLLNAHLLTAKPLPRIQQWGLGRREQDRALTELKLALAGGPPPKRQGNYHRGPRTTKAAEAAAAVEASGDSDAATRPGDAGASAKAGSQQPEKQGTAGHGEASSCARDNDDDASSTVSGDGSSRGPRRGVKRAREEDRPRAAAAAAAAAPAAAAKGPKGAKGAKAKGPQVEVLEDDSILVDGVPVCAPGDPFYSRLFGLAQMEKHKDPEWHIANGIVDRCYYRGSKKEAKQRPGVDYFPTDQSMMADFVRRKPDVFITQVMQR